jgi:hypothetical protein
LQDKLLSRDLKSKIVFKRHNITRCIPGFATQRQRPELGAALDQVLMFSQS